MTPLRNVSLAADVVTVRAQLQALVQAEPPPQKLDALYFGLFDAVDENGGEAIGDYVAGVQNYDADNPDSLCDPAWWPDGRHLQSKVLAAVKAVELAASQAGHEDAREFLGYTGQLGIALLLSKFASAGVVQSRRCVVGFDSGDFAEVESPIGMAG